MGKASLYKIAVFFIVICMMVTAAIPMTAWAEEEGFSILSSPAEGDAYVYSGWASNSSQSVTFPDGIVIDGTQPGAYSTIKQGVSGVQAGRTLFIADGSYTGANNRNITINKNISMIGQSLAGTVIDAQQASRIFTISAGRNVTIRNITMANGQISTVSGFDFYFGGGAIFNKGTLTVNDCAFTGNTAQGNDVFVGGAVYNYENSTLKINHCIFLNNVAQDWGGAIYSDWYATLEIKDSTFTGNTAPFGGAICSSTGLLTVEGSTFANNSATADYNSGGGGAISSSADEVLVKDCAFISNTAAADGGAISFASAAAVEDSIFTDNSADSGGAVHNGENATLIVTGSTFTNNTGGNYGGAIVNYGKFNLEESILVQNSAAGYGGALYTGFDDCNISNSTFESNRVTSTWSGDGKGGAVCSFDCILRLDTCDFINNLADNNGGAIYNDEPWFRESSTLEAINCNFTDNRTNTGINRNGGAIYNCDILMLKACDLSNNTAGTDGGAIYNDGGNAEIHFNRITGNMPGNSQISHSSGTMNIANNWWGDNEGSDGKIAGIGLTPATWLVLTVSRDREVLDLGESSTVTADLLYDNQGNYYAPSNGHIPDGIPVAFNESGIPPLGSFNPLSGTMVDGQASTAFTANRPGAANIMVSVDNQQVSAQIDIEDIAIIPGRPDTGGRARTSELVTIDSAGNITAAPKFNQNTFIATTEIGTSILNKAFERVAKNSDGKRAVEITINVEKGAKAYEPTLPASALTSSGTGTEFVIKTGFASVTLSGGMLEQEAAAGAEKVSLTVAQTDSSDIDNEEARERIGGRPVIQLSLKLDGKPYAWSNENTPVTVSIPYQPTAQELADSEHITVWYIDGRGNVAEVPSGRYDPATGTVTFSTTHFSNFTVVYVTKTYDDLGRVAWAKKPIEVLASKGILKGISETEYAPQTNITRADFLYCLVRTLGADAKADGNFDDIGKDAYYYKEIAAARKLGITGGTGNNKFSPDAGITRQDMMVLTERALRMLNRLDAQGTASDLSQFADKSLVAAYAVNGVASVVKEGLITGSGGKINPRGNTTRAEAAVFLYRIYNND